LQGRIIKKENLKAIIDSRRYYRNPEKSDETFFAELIYCWKEEIKLSKRVDRLDKELGKKITELNNAKADLAQQIFWVVDYLCEGLRSKHLTVKWTSEHELVLGNGISIKKNSDHPNLILIWTNAKLSFSIPLEQCEKLISLLTDMG
jgi:hypothetical protein